MPRSIPYDDYLIEFLKNQRRAKAYLNAALEAGDPRVFRMALRNVAQARGFNKVAAKSALNRESLYKMLSKRGNPSVQTSTLCSTAWDSIRLWRPKTRREMRQQSTRISLRVYKDNGPSLKPAAIISGRMNCLRPHRQPSNV